MNASKLIELLGKVPGDTVINITTHEDTGTYSHDVWHVAVSENSAGDKWATIHVDAS